MQTPNRRGRDLSIIADEMFNPPTPENKNGDKAVCHERHLIAQEGRAKKVSRPTHWVRN
jgi:hypothetical protein